MLDVRLKSLKERRTNTELHLVEKIESKFGSCI